MIHKLIDKTKTSDLLFLSGVVLNYMNTNKDSGDLRSSILPELFSSLGVDTTINLIKYFGGETIAIPSHQEMTESFLVIICYYKKKVEDKDWAQIKEEVGIDINPHHLGKIIERMDADINLKLQDLRESGVADYMEKFQNLKGDKA